MRTMQAYKKTQNTRLEGTLKIIWSNFAWQKHGLDKVAQHSVQLDLKKVQCWRTHHFPWEIISVADCSHCENFPLLSNWNFPRRNQYTLPLVFSMWLLGKRKSPSSLKPPFTYRDMVISSSLRLHQTKQAQISAFLWMAGFPVIIFVVLLLSLFSLSTKCKVVAGVTIITQCFETEDT